MDIQRPRTRSAASQLEGSVSAAVAGSSGDAGTSAQQPQGSRTDTDTPKASYVKVEAKEEKGSSSSDSDNDDDDEEYGDMHRLVLQGVMAAGYLDAKGVKKLFEESCRFLQCKVPAAEHLSPPFIQKVVREINKRINNFDMMIRSATCEITGEKYYVCLVTMEKQIMRAQTIFTKVELDLFQKIINSVLRKHNNFMITMNECINMGAEVDSRFSKVNAEDFVNKMINLKYLAKAFKDDQKQEFELTLGFRTIREFETIFRESFSKCFGTCCLCKMIMLNGFTCPKCPTVYHRGCLKKYIKKCKACVNCKGQWKNESSLLVRTMDGSYGKTSATPETSQETSSSSRAERLASVSSKSDETSQRSQSRNDDIPTTSSKDSSENSTSSSSKMGECERESEQRVDSSSESD